MLSTPRVRQSIPVIPVPRERPRFSWRRVRDSVVAVATRVVDTARVVASRAMAAVTEAGRRAKARIARLAHAVMVHRPWIATRDGAAHAAGAVASWSKDTWHRVVRPFLRVRIVAVGIATFLVGLVVSPVATIIVTAVAGLALVGAAHGIERLERRASDSPAARAALRAIEWVARLGWALAYVVTAAMVVILCAASLPFAVTEALELVLRYAGVADAVAISALVFFVLTGHWVLAAAEIAWYVATRPARGREGAMRERQPISMIRLDADQAWNGSSVVHIVPGTEIPLAAKAEIVETLDQAEKPRVKGSVCMGCDLDDNGPRFGIGKLTSLCDTCFACLVEDELIKAADAGEVSPEDVTRAIDNGVQVPGYVVIATGARLQSQRVEYDLEAITCRTSARVDSEKDPSRIYWVETAWWFDGRGLRRARRWHGFVDGRLEARVDYQHDKSTRGFYVATMDGAPLHGPYRKLDKAQEVAADVIIDAALAARASASVATRMAETRSAS